MQSELLNNEDFLYLKEKIFSLAGLHYTEKKWDLVQSRMQTLFRKSKIKSVAELKTKLESNDSSAIQDFINLLTTNKTDFFREPQHFEFIISELIPTWIQAQKKEINVWSCASSTGEEPYSLALVLQKHLPSHIKWNILASDIDTNVLSYAENGVYSSEHLKDIPDMYHDYISKTEKADCLWFKISDTVYRNMQFKQHNLMNSLTSANKSFDLILCRNVLIYFQRETINNLIQNLHQVLTPDGCLIVGHSETIHDATRLFTSHKTSVFLKK